MGSVPSTANFKGIEVRDPVVRYIQDDRGYKGVIAHRTLSVDDCTFTYSPSEDLPRKVIQEFKQKTLAIENADADKTSAVARFPEYDRLLKRIESLKIWSSQSNARKMLAKLGYFHLARDNEMCCFWCGLRVSVTNFPTYLSSNSNSTDFYHQCKYSNYMKLHSDKPSCIDEGKEDDNLCRKAECPLCRWDL